MPNIREFIDSALNIYEGHRLVIRKRNGTLCGAAWPLGGGAPPIKLEGNNEVEVRAKLEALIDGTDPLDLSAWQARVAKKHQKYLERKGFDDKGRGRIQFSRRFDVCHGCHGLVDNRVDLECIGCGWIICSTCGACGCGAPRRLFPL